MLPIITSTDDELSSGTNIDDLEIPWTPKIKVFSDFSRFQAAIHILRVNCAKPSEIGQDNLHTKCSALKVDFNGVGVDPLGSSSSPYECVKFGYPLQNARFLLLSSNLARERLIRHRLAAHHNKHYWRAFQVYQHRWPWTTLNPKNRSFSEYFAILGCDALLEWIFADITGHTQRQPWYEIKLMLSIARLMSISSDFLSCNSERCGSKTYQTKNTHTVTYFLRV